MSRPRVPTPRVPTHQGVDMNGNPLHYSHTKDRVKYFVQGQNHHHGGHVVAGGHVVVGGHVVAGGHGGPAHEQAIYRVPKPTIHVIAPAHPGNRNVLYIGGGHVQAIHRVPKPTIHLMPPAHPGSYGVERTLMIGGTL